MARSNEWKGFGDVRAFFHSKKAHTADRFADLFTQTLRVYASQPDDVVEQWLPYMEEHLGQWPLRSRQVEWMIDPDKERAHDRFLDADSPVYRLLHTLYKEDDHSFALTPYMLRMAYLPWSASLQRLDLCWWSECPSPEQLAAMFQHPEVTWQLRELCLAMDFTDEHVKVLAHCPCLGNLQSLQLIGHHLTREGMMTLAASPHWKGLRRLLLAEEPMALHHRYENEHLEVLLRHKDIEEMVGHLPALEALLDTPSLPPLDAVQGDEPVVVRDPVKARLDTILDLYRSGGSPGDLALDGEGALASFVALSAAQWSDETLTLKDVYPDLPVEEGYPAIYVVAVEQGRLATCFDAEGALVQPLALRMFARRYCAPDNRVMADYNGQCLFQTQCAEYGLAVDEDAMGVLWLTPEGHDRQSDLVKFHAAVDVVHELGATCVLCACHPYGEVIGGIINTYNEASLVEWNEEAHMFDRSGDLSGGLQQKMIVLGDVIALRTQLAKVGLIFEASSHPDYCVLRRVLP